MENKQYASKATASTGVALGATALGVTLLNGGLGNLFGGGAAAGAIACEDKIALTSAIYQSRITQMEERFADRNVLNLELFEIYKTGRDRDDVLSKRISDLEASAALVHERTINYIDKLDCWNIKGSKILESTPTVTGFPSAPSCGGCCGC